MPCRSFELSANAAHTTPPIKNKEGNPLVVCEQCLWQSFRYMKTTLFYRSWCLVFGIFRLKEVAAVVPWGMQWSSGPGGDQASTGEVPLLPWPNHWNTANALWGKSNNIPPSCFVVYSYSDAETDNDSRNQVGQRHCFDCAESTKKQQFAKPFMMMPRISRKGENISSTPVCSNIVLASTQRVWGGFCKGVFFGWGHSRHRYRGLSDKRR